MPFKDCQIKKEYYHKRYLSHKNEIKQKTKEWRKNNRKLYNRMQSKNAKKYGYKFQKEYSRKRRIECLTHYGGDPPKCACCGESHIGFLTIDHNEIKPDKKYRSGDNLYGWILNHNFPEGFKVMCLNCNHHIGRYGWCPHER